jgi:anti-sigma factor RsiW
MERDQTDTCSQFDPTAWLLISGELDDPARSRLERHVAACGRCAALLAERRRLLDLYDGLVPAPQVAFDLRTAAGRRASVVASRPVLALAAGLLLFVAGALAGHYRTGSDNGARQGVERRLSDLEVRLAMARIDRPGAAERLQATTSSAALVNRDPRILDTLLEALESDPSPNVRLAAVDALYEARSVAAIERRFPTLLAAQTSPILRIALIELAGDRRLAGALDELRRVAAESTDDLVARRAQWAINALTGGA